MESSPNLMSSTVLSPTAMFSHTSDYASDKLAQPLNHETSWAKQIPELTILAASLLDQNVNIPSSVSFGVSVPAIINLKPFH